MIRVEVSHAELVRDVAARLAAAGVPTPEVDARLLVEHVVEVVGDPTGCGGALLDGLVARRVAREPLQLVLGRTWFRTLELECAPGVFIPRPETEVVAGFAIAAARDHGAATVVEPCCGTGAIGLSVAVEVPDVRVVCGDVDPRAVELARTNLARVVAGAAGPSGLASGSAVEVVVSDLLDGLDPMLAGRVDVLVANPPYLPSGDRGSWEPEVAEHDPGGALVGGDDGHEVVDALVAAAPRWLAAGGILVVEVDERRADDAADRARHHGLVEVRVEPDLTGAPRAVLARRPR